jgi:CheY-like chemotaxis protein
MESNVDVSNATILLVEDDKDLREIVAEILESGGYRVIPAVNGQEGIDRLREQVTRGAAPDLVLLDLTMPVKDGFEFLTEQQQDDALAAVPVVAMSADNGITQKLVGYKARDYLKKPVEIDALLATCARYCTSVGAAGDHGAVDQP